jgi:hypothetical protein
MSKSAKAFCEVPVGRTFVYQNMVTMDGKPVGFEKQDDKFALNLVTKELKEFHPNTRVE